VEELDLERKKMIKLLNNNKNWKKKRNYKKSKKQQLKLRKIRRMLTTMKNKINYQIGIIYMVR
jgi:hypothetical protein